MFPPTSFLNSYIILYPVAPRGLVSSSMYVIFRGICIYSQAIAMTVFMLIFVILSLPHCSLSLTHFTSICFAHNCTWCCKFLHPLQKSAFVSAWHSFFNSPAHLLIPSILGILSRFYHKYEFHIPLALCRLSH